MWGGSITREYLLRKISLLAMLGLVGEDPKEYELVSRPDRVSSLTVDQEGEIVSNLAFLSSRRKDSKMVIAIGIEEDRDGQGMTIRMAVNGDHPVYVKEGLARISAILERISRRGKTQSSKISQQSYC